MDPYFGAKCPHYKSYILCYNVRITILPLLKYQKYTMNLCLKMLVENIILRVFNILRDIVYQEYGIFKL
jgi:hypothetical protein